MRVIDLFCGAGGLSLGLARAGLRTSIGVDLDSDSLETFAACHPDAEVIKGDVLSVIENLPNFGKKIRMTPIVLAGGLPCQGF